MLRRLLELKNRAPIWRRYLSGVLGGVVVVAVVILFVMGWTYIGRSVAMVTLDFISRRFPLFRKRRVGDFPVYPPDETILNVSSRLPGKSAPL
jgi:hypothetical protein